MKPKTCIQVLITLTVFLLVGSETIEARQFRLLSPITSPDQVNKQLPAGAKPVENVQPFSRAEVEPLVRDVLEKWNTGEMASTLSEQFYDKTRLLDIVDTGVPRDATLRIQSIQGIQTLGQYIVPGDGDERGEIVSTVSATVRSQLEFNNSAGQFVSLSGRNELILEIRTAAPP